jgi:hypothetical protein
MNRPLNFIDPSGECPSVSLEQGCQTQERNDRLHPNETPLSRFASFLATIKEGQEQWSNQNDEICYCTNAERRTLTAEKRQAIEAFATTYGTPGFLPTSGKFGVGAEKIADMDDWTVMYYYKALTTPREGGYSASQEEIAKAVLDAGGQIADNFGNLRMSEVGVKKVNNANTSTTSNTSSTTKTPGLKTDINDITKGNSVRNTSANTTKSDFIDNLKKQGYVQSTSKDGKVTILTKGNTTYNVCDTAKSTGGPTAEVFQNGQLTQKIRIQP